MGAARINAYLVCGGSFHDMDFARLELLKLLGEHENIRVRVGESYADGAAIAAADFLLTYTCDVIPPAPEQQPYRAEVHQPRCQSPDPRARQRVARPCPGRSGCPRTCSAVR